MHSFTRFTLAGALALVLAFSTAFAQEGSVSPYAKVVKDVSYKGSDPRNTLDLYYPQEGSGPYPTHVFLHGGGWVNGRKNIGGQTANVFQKLAENGFLGISLEYRLVDAKENRYMHACAVDTMDAMRYLIENAEALQIDPENIFIWGESAGAHLALLATTAPLDTFPGGNETPQGIVNAPIKAVAAWFPPTDMLNYEDISVEHNGKLRDLSKRMGRTVADDPVAFIEISPLEHLTRNDPPALLIHGDKDTAVHLEHSLRYARKAEQLGVPCEVVVVKNANHSFRKAGEEALSPSLEEITALTAQFFIDQSKTGRAAAATAGSAATGAAQ